MFEIEDKTIHITRGDIATFTVDAETQTGESYAFKARQSYHRYP